MNCFLVKTLQPIGILHESQSCSSREHPYHGGANSPSGTFSIYTLDANSNTLKSLELFTPFQRILVVKPIYARLNCTFGPPTMAFLRKSSLNFKISKTRPSTIHTVALLVFR